MTLKLSRQVYGLRALVMTAAAAGIFASASAMGAPADNKKPVVTGDAAKSVKAVRPLSEEDKIVHALNRLGYGPRPGDVERVKALGLSRYIDQQLNPEKIDDPSVDKKLASFAELQLSGEQLAAKYHDLMQSSKQAQAMRKKLTKQKGTGPATATDSNADPADPAMARKQAQRALAADPAMRREMMQNRQEMAQSATPVARAHEEFMAAKALRAIESERQMQEVLVDFWGNHFNIDIRKAPCGVLKIIDDREVIRPHTLGKFRDLLGASAKSPAMLVYLDNFQSMAENTQTAQAGPAGRMPANRARRLQRLQQMAQTPGAPPMLAKRLQALQAQSQAPGAPPKTKKKQPSGLNENYAREIMELHTLGVDGGYTQQDVKEVARCFTGWTIASEGGRRAATGRYAEAGTFQFRPVMHDNGEKKVLGQVIPAGGGQQDGEKVLDILASHPATMRHISEQLCQRFVSDEPPASLVEKCVAAWKRTDGDLREIVRTIVTSPEFYAPTAVRSKIKSPFEYAASSVRALGGTYETAVAVHDTPQPRQALSLIKPPKGGGYLDMDTVSVVGQIGTMGQPLFQYQAPTGYPEDSRKWVSSGALISRLNFALALTGGKLADVRLKDGDSSAPVDPDRAIDRTAAQILHVPISPATRATLVKQVRLASDEPGMRRQPVTGSRVAALLLGSPEFQRH